MKRSSLFKHLKNKWIIAAIVLIVVIALIAWARAGGSAPTFQYATAQTADVVERVSVTGAVSPLTKADLAFKKGGVISSISLGVGDRVSRGQAIASLDDASDRAAVAAAQATLADASRGLTAEELSVQQSSLSTAEKAAVNAAHDGLSQAQTALFNDTDVFFTNAQSSNPSIFIRTGTVQAKNAIESERLGATTELTAWSSELGDASLSPEGLVAKAHAHLSVIKGFMNDLSVLVNQLNTANANLSQQALNAYIASMNAGQSAIDAAVTAVTSAETALASAQSAYDLRLAGNSQEYIAAQAARVDQARADLAADTLVSPIDGIVTRADPHVGEYVAPGSSGFAVQGSGFKIEAYVPEADIAKVAIGDLASSTLDAYGSDTDFPAHVTAIDPAETVLEGVPTYKVTLEFVAPDARIRSGMTANLDIVTHVRPGVLAVPFRAIVDAAGAKSVRIVSADGMTYASVPVTTGLKGSDGLIEIVSGLKVGDKVVTYVK